MHSMDLSPGDRNPPRQRGRGFDGPFPKTARNAAHLLLTQTSLPLPIQSIHCTYSLNNLVLWLTLIKRILDRNDDAKPVEHVAFNHVLWARFPKTARNATLQFLVLNLCSHSMPSLYNVHTLSNLVLWARFIMRSRSCFLTFICYDLHAPFSSRYSTSLPIPCIRCIICIH